MGPPRDSLKEVRRKVAETLRRAKWLCVDELGLRCAEPLSAMAIELRKRRILLLPIAIIGVLFHLSWRRFANMDDAIAGAWVSEYGSQMTFSEDGTLHMFVVVGEHDRAISTGNGRWRVQGSTLYLLDTTGGSSLSEYLRWALRPENGFEIRSVTAERLELTGSTGDTIEWSRASSAE